MRALIVALFPTSKVIPNHRPDWLRGCELDAYLPSENLAFEYDGQQHREFTPHFHRTIDAFTSQVERDGWKRSVCKERGIRVLTIIHSDIISAEVFANRVVELIAQEVDEPREPRIPVRRVKPKRKRFAQPIAAPASQERAEFLSRVQTFLESRPVTKPLRKKGVESIRAKGEKDYPKRRAKR
jgi:hypothetical protein